MPFIIVAVARSAGWEVLSIEIVYINTYSKTNALPKSLETFVLGICSAAS